ncbi:MAG TPA: aminopeptidase P family protein [Nitrospirae bacterium]|nr:aminopeptidase P family protein [Nitrospirota bacterium]
MQKKAILRKKLSTLGVDGILITDLFNVRYLTGFTGTSGYIIITSKHALFVTDFRYKEQALDEVKGFKIMIEYNERSREIKEITDKYGIRTLGFEDHNVPYSYYNKFSKRKIKLKALTGVVESLRVVKTPAELSFMKTAVKRAEAAFRKLAPFIKTGVTEVNLALKLEALLKQEGCKTLPFGVIVASGFMSALPHAKPTGKALKEGDLVVFDWGGECGGYYSDMTRTVLLNGKNISRQKELYNIVLEAHKRAVNSIKPGIAAAIVDAAARDHINDKGYNEFFGHGTGHGVGLEVHEDPNVSWRTKEILKENMVFTVEPGIYLPGFGGVRIEDLVVVTKHGAKSLNTLSKKLKIIERQ